MSACVEEDGRPNHQVMRFHTIAPTSAASTATSVSRVPTSSMWMIS